MGLNLATDRADGTLQVVFVNRQTGIATDLSGSLSGRLLAQVDYVEGLDTDADLTYSVSERTFADGFVAAPQFTRGRDLTLRGTVYGTNGDDLARKVAEIDGLNLVRKDVSFSGLPLQVSVGVDGCDGDCVREYDFYGVLKKPISWVAGGGTLSRKFEIMLYVEPLPLWSELAVPTVTGVGLLHQPPLSLPHDEEKYFYTFNGLAGESLEINFIYRLLSDGEQIGEVCGSTSRILYSDRWWRKTRYLISPSEVTTTYYFIENSPLDMPMPSADDPNWVSGDYPSFTDTRSNNTVLLGLSHSAGTGQGIDVRIFASTISSNAIFEQPCQRYEAA